MDDRRQPAAAATTAKSSTGMVGAGTLNGKYGSTTLQALETKRGSSAVQAGKDSEENAA